jgi:hypothetical protein
MREEKAVLRREVEYLGGGNWHFFEDRAHSPLLLTTVEIDEVLAGRAANWDFLRLTKEVRLGVVRRSNPGIVVAADLDGLQGPRRKQKLQQSKVVSHLVNGDLGVSDLALEEDSSSIVRKNKEAIQLVVVKLLPTIP